MHKWIFLILLLLGSCSPQEPKNKRKEVYIEGRIPKLKVYKALIPSHWQQIPLVNSSDTTKPIGEWTIEKDLKITLHNFPVHSIKERVPPQAQIERWQRQFQNIEDSHISSFSHSGFGGFQIEAYGQIKNQEQGMLAFAMQLTPTLFNLLNQARSWDEEVLFSEMRGDWTIKAMGPKDLIQMYKNEIIEFAESFEWIYFPKMP